MSVLSIMMFDEGFDWRIRCRFISEWCKVDSYVPDKEGLLAEIERNRPDVVVMDLDLYATMDGIETSRKIRNRFDVPVCLCLNLDSHRMISQLLNPLLKCWIHCRVPG